MSNFLIGSLAVLLLIIFILLFRVQSLVSIVRGSDNKKGGLLNKFNAAMFIVFMVVGTVAFLWYSFGFKDSYMLPEASSLHGIETDKMFWLSIGIISIVFLVVNILLFGFAFKYQYKKDRKATHFAHNNQLELIWTIIPAIVLTYLVFNGWKEWTNITDTPTQKEQDEAVQLEIVGQQFSWSVRYPGEDKKLGKHDFTNIDAINSFGLKLEDKASLDDFMPREIHIPKGKKVQFKIRAKDVLHSVFAPHFRLKMDAVPGMPTQFWFTPTKTTQEMRNELALDPAYQTEVDGEKRYENFNYEIACTEVCGRGHFSMRMVIVVDEPEDYEKWYKEQKAWSIDNKDYILEQLAENDAKQSMIDEYDSYINSLDPENTEVASAEEEKSLQKNDTDESVKDEEGDAENTEEGEVDEHKEDVSAVQL